MKLRSIYFLLAMTLFYQPSEYLDQIYQRLYKTNYIRNKSYYMLRYYFSFWVFDNYMIT